jgi:hypothetical protein
MKKVIVQGVMEESQFFCDRHPDRECFSELKTASWYGSVHDLTGVEVHLCDECLGELYALLEQKFGVKPKDIEI